MPCLRIFTNLPRNKIPNDFVAKILPILAKSQNKPIEKYICLISGDCQLSMAGDAEAPGAISTLESIGVLGPEENKVIVKAISEFVQQELQIEPARFFISMYDLKAHEMGENGITLAEMC